MAIGDRYDEFLELGAEVLALSTDAIDSHERWVGKARSEGGLAGLRFPLGSDPSGEVANAYQVHVESRHLALRAHYVIDPNSVIQVQVVHTLPIGRRVDEILRVLNALQVGGLCAESWTPGQPVIDPTAALRPGSVISHFRIEEQVGAGAFATVYRAYDQTLQRSVALKVLKPQENQAPNILEEARSAAALSHPNVCTVYSIDHTDGVSMIVMEYLDGESLQVILERGPLSPKLAVDVGRQIAAGMATAHAAGIVHGDLKPANVVLIDERIAKVLDFGLAGRRRPPTHDDATVSVRTDGASVFAGTPRYMSPEQAEGTPATRRSDVFAFGLVLYELFTGRRVFAEQNVIKLLGQVRSFDPETILSGVPNRLGSLLGRMLVPQADSRSITMSEVADELARENL